VRETPDLRGRGTWRISRGIAADSIAADGIAADGIAADIMR
jgi:hypothetical protein